jgi:hypothetical protein
MEMQVGCGDVSLAGHQPGEAASRLAGGLAVDVAVMGGGLAGLTAAVLLREAGEDSA